MTIVRDEIAPPASAVGSILEAEIAYAARGWPGLVLVPGDKIPIKDDDLQPHGRNSATTDQAIIRELFRRYSHANIGTVTGPESGIAAVDYDGPHAPALAKANGLTAPATRTVRTPRGGYHVYIAHDAAIPNRAGLLADDCTPKPCQLDARAAGGYVVAPPSVVGGRQYVVIRDLPIAPWPEFVEFCRARMPKPIPKSERTAQTGDGLIARIKAAWTVEELAERLGARLIGQGDQLKARCPLHGERTGFAFVIWRRDQRWKCFGKCNAGGDVVDLHVAARGRGLL